MEAIYKYYVNWWKSVSKLGNATQHNRPPARISTPKKINSIPSLTLSGVFKMLWPRTTSLLYLICFLELLSHSGPCHELWCQECGGKEWDQREWRMLGCWLPSKSFIAPNLHISVWSLIVTFQTCILCYSVHYASSFTLSELENWPQRCRETKGTV